jgi:hypothetical protein
MPTESKTVKTARREYEQVKRLYHKVGEKAAGTPPRSRPRRDYAEVKREYERLGKRLGKLTKKRPRS